MYIHTCRIQHSKLRIRIKNLIRECFNALRKVGGNLPWHCTAWVPLCHHQRLLGLWLVWRIKCACALQHAPTHTVPLPLQGCVTGVVPGVKTRSRCKSHEFVVNEHWPFAAILVFRAWLILIFIPDFNARHNDSCPWQ